MPLFTLTEKDINMWLISNPIMAMKKCNFCENKVPENGQCNKCGFIDGLNRPPSDNEFKQARDVNTKHNYDQFENIDMLLLD